MPWIPDSGPVPHQYQGRPTMNSNRDPLDEKVSRFEKAVRELIKEGHTFADHEAWLDAAATRAGVDLQEVLPTEH
jgi:hypothetical protein